MFLLFLFLLLNMINYGQSTNNHSKWIINEPIQRSDGSIIGGLLGNKCKKCWIHQHKTDRIIPPEITNYFMF